MLSGTSSRIRRDASARWMDPPASVAARPRRAARLDCDRMKAAWAEVIVHRANKLWNLCNPRESSPISTNCASSIAPRRTGTPASGSCPPARESSYRLARSAVRQADSAGRTSRRTQWRRGARRQLVCMRGIYDSFSEWLAERKSSLPSGSNAVYRIDPAYAGMRSFLSGAGLPR